MKVHKNIAGHNDNYFIITLLLVVIFMTLPIDAEARKRNGTKATGAIDAKTFEVLTKAQELTEAGQYNEAIQTLDTIKNSDKLNSYAKSQMWNFYAFIYASQEKYKDAIGAYKRIVAEDDAPEGLKLTAKYTMAQLYFQIEDYQSVINFMEQWLKEIKKPTATAHIMLAQAYYQRKIYDPALKNLDKAIVLEAAEGKKVKENWLRMKAAIYFEKKDTKSTLKTYEELLQHYPNITYLRQIAGLNGELGNDRKRLTTYDAIYLQGGLKNESEVLNLAYMYLGQEIPYKAGKIIETGMEQNLIKQNPKNVETLANAWAQANEHKKAIPALEKAASLSDKGILYARLAGVYFDAGDFKQAAEAAKLADEKGGLKRKDSNHMLMGMASFNIKDYEGALQAFRQAKQSKKSFADARKWEAYTLSELERLRALEASKFALAEKTKDTLTADENNAEVIGKNMLADQTDDSVQQAKTEKETQTKTEENKVP
jgi:tetratricopeptide (TPR) repeat protein